MKKKILIVITGIALIVFILLSGRLKESLFSGSSDLSIADTSKISFFTIMAKDTLNFHRAAGSWIINDEFKANPTAVSNFLFLFKNIDIKGLTLDGERAEASSIKLAIRMGRKTKRYRFYSVKPDPLIHFEGSSKYYQVEIKGAESADLSRIISADINHWRDKLLFGFQINEIKSIKSTPKKAWGKGFEMFRKNDSFLLKNQNGLLLNSTEYDSDHLLMYAGYFKQVFFDSAINFSHNNDILIEAEPQYEMNITLLNGKNHYIQIYAIQNPYGHEDLYNAGCRLDLGEEMYVVPYVYLDPLLMSIEQFLVE